MLLARHAGQAMIAAGGWPRGAPVGGIPSSGDLVDAVDSAGRSSSGLFFDETCNIL
jgi:hypothetical protein